MMRFRPEAIQATMDTIVYLLNNKRIENVIDSVFTLHKASEAHRCVEERRAVGKVLLLPNG